MKRATISLFIKIISFQQNKNVIHNNESNKYISIFDIAQSSIYGNEDLTLKLFRYFHNKQLLKKYLKQLLIVSCTKLYLFKTPIITPNAPSN